MYLSRRALFSVIVGAAALGAAFTVGAAALAARIVQPAAVPTAAVHTTAPETAPPPIVVTLAPEAVAVLLQAADGPGDVPDEARPPQSEAEPQIVVNAPTPDTKSGLVGQRSFAGGDFGDDAQQWHGVTVNGSVTTLHLTGDASASVATEGSIAGVAEIDASVAVANANEENATATAQAAGPDLPAPPPPGPSGVTDGDGPPSPTEASTPDPNPSGSLIDLTGAGGDGPIPGWVTSGEAPFDLTLSQG